MFHIFVLVALATGGAEPSILRSKAEYPTHEACMANIAGVLKELKPEADAKGIVIKNSGCFTDAQMLEILKGSDKPVEHGI